MIDFSHYVGREQTWVKHVVLSEYLQRFGPIIGSWCSAITYVDCFSGPWKQTSENYEDTSFFIALQELRKARETQRQRGRDVKLRAFFIEKDPVAYQKLRSFADQIPSSDVEIETRNGELENCIGDIVRFVEAGGKKNFPFLFIDPTGWTGFGLEAIKPLLELDPGEVLVNFMTGHIRRLVEHPDEAQQEGFEALYGKTRCSRVLALVKGKNDLDREDILVSAYMDALQEVGHYSHASAAVVLNPAMDRTHFHLIYGTRNPKGMEVFKGAEKKAMDAMQQARADVKDRRQDERTRQPAFAFIREVPRLDSHYQELRDHYTEIGKKIVLNAIRSAGRLSFDLAYTRALVVPLTFESDLKSWTKDWQKSGLVKLEGLKPRAYVPQLGEEHFLVWTGPTTGE